MHGEKTWGLQGQIQHMEVEMWMAGMGAMQKTVANSDDVRYKIEYTTGSWKQGKE